MCSSEGAIKDFFYIRGTIRSPEETRYMELSEYKNMTGKFPTVREVREAGEAEAQQAGTDSSPDDMDALLEALKRKFNTNDRR